MDFEMTLANPLFCALDPRACNESSQVAWFPVCRQSGSWPETGLEEIGTRLAIQPHHTSPKPTSGPALRGLPSGLPVIRPSALELTSQP